MDIFRVVNLIKEWNQNSKKIVANISFSKNGKILLWLIWNRSDAYLGVFALTIESRPEPRRICYYVVSSTDEFYNRTAKNTFFRRSRKIFHFLVSSGKLYGTRKWRLKMKFKAKVFIVFWFSSLYLVLFYCEMIIW